MHAKPLERNIVYVLSTAVIIPPRIAAVGVIRVGKSWCPTCAATTAKQADNIGRHFK
jgi:hypothetical protein